MRVKLQEIHPRIPNLFIVILKPGFPPHCLDTVLNFGERGSGATLRMAVLQYPWSEFNGSYFREPPSGKTVPIIQHRQGNSPQLAAISPLVLQPNRQPKGSANFLKYIFMFPLLPRS